MGMFALLGVNFDRVAQDGGLREVHVDMEVLAQKVEEVFEERSLEKAQSAFQEWKESNESHLKKEEEIIMPRVMQLAKQMTTEILPLIVDSPDFEFWVKFANEILDTHPGGMPRVRVFDHSLWACATPEQWVVWNQWIKESLPVERYNEVQIAIHGNEVET